MFELLPFSPSGLVSLIWNGFQIFFVISILGWVLPFAYKLVNGRKQESRKDSSDLLFAKRRIAKFAFRHHLSPEKVKEIYTELEELDPSQYNTFYSDFKSAVFEAEIESKKNAPTNGGGVDSQKMASAYCLLIEAVAEGNVDEQKEARLRKCLDNASTDYEVDAVIATLSRL